MRARRTCTDRTPVRPHGRCSQRYSLRRRTSGPSSLGGGRLTQLRYCGVQTQSRRVRASWSEPGTCSPHRQTQLRRSRLCRRLLSHPLSSPTSSHHLVVLSYPQPTRCHLRVLAPPPFARLLSPPPLFLSTSSRHLVVLSHRPSHHCHPLVGRSPPLSPRPFLRLHPHFQPSPRNRSSYSRAMSGRSRRLEE